MAAESLPRQFAVSVLWLRIPMSSRNRNVLLTGKAAQNAVHSLYEALYCAVSILALASLLTFALPGIRRPCRAPAITSQSR